ncbi:MAG TPA: nidogen-like domain-containing protein, partial [Sandaracinaceae bacterium]
GFDAGDGRTFEILPGSGSAAVLDLCRTSNVGVPGIWEFDIYRGTPQMSLPAGGEVETQDFSRRRARPPRRRRR